MSERTLTDGSPVTPGHREIDPRTGMQKGYVVLSESERAKGYRFLRKWSNRPLADPLAPQVRAVAKLRRQHKPSAAAMRALRDARHARMRRAYS